MDFARLSVFLSAGRPAPRTVLTLALAAALVASVGPVHARPNQPDTRSKVEIRAHLDEPTWAFAGSASEIVIDFVVPPAETRRPTGTLTVQLNERGALPETRILTGDEGDVRLYLTSTRTGMRHYTVTYSGDTYFQAAKKTFSYEVWTGPLTKTSLQASAKKPVTVSEPVKLTAQVTTDDGKALTGTSDGPIVFYADDKFLGEGVVVPGSRGWKATLVVNYLPVGAHRLTARHESVIRYSGPESEPVSLQVLPPADPLPLDGVHTLTVTSPFTVRMDVTLTQRTGAPDPGGYVQFYADGIEYGLPVPVTAGLATSDFLLPTAPRTFTFSAAYFGDNHYAPITFPGQTLTVPLP